MRKGGDGAIRRKGSERQTLEDEIMLSSVGRQIQTFKLQASNVGEILRLPEDKVVIWSF